MDGISWASSAMVAARTRLDIATGNLANVSSDGFATTVARGHLSAAGVTIERCAASQRGDLRHTGRPLDVAIVGNGNFFVQSGDGHVERTRDGAFSRDRDEVLRDSAGRAVIGARGVIRLPDTATIGDDGRIVVDGRETHRFVLPADTTLRTGFLESANVNAVGEMIDVLAAQRGFESAEKVVAAIDGTRQKTANDVARVK